MKFDLKIEYLGKVENTGFEFELQSTILRRDNFVWTAGFLGSRNENKLLDFADSDGQIQNVDSKRAAEWINLQGNPISSFYGWVVDREIPKEYLNDAFHPVGGQAQDVYVKDLNGDGVIDDDDKTILGDPYPDLVWSFGSEFRYGNFDLSFLFQGSHGAQTYNLGDQYIFDFFNSNTVDFNPATAPDQQFLVQRIFTSQLVQK